MSDSLQRREFLGTAAAVGVLGWAGTDSAQAQQAPAQAAAQKPASEKILIAVAGTGGRGTSLATSFQRLPGVEIAYVCDVDSARAERAAGLVQKAGGRSVRALGDFRRALDDKNVDVLVVATCNHWHAPAALLGCAAGKHVYVEKPCSHNAREGELLVQSARKHKKVVQMGNQRRSWPKVIETIQEVRKGVIGRAYLAQSWYMNNRPTIGVGKPGEAPKNLNYDLWQGPATRRPFKSNILHYNWHWFWHWGNGELGNNGVHMIDLCRWGLGVDYPIRVTSSGGRYRYEDDQETPDTHIVNYEFEGRKQISWEGLSCSRQPLQPYHTLFHGERGTLALSDSSYTIFDHAGKEVRKEKVVTGDAFHLTNFLEAVRGNATLNSEIEEAHKTTLLCHLGNIAHRTGRALRCDARNGHIQEDKAAMAMWTREYAKGFEPRV